jgi:hypothetical protein
MKDGFPESVSEHHRLVRKLPCVICGQWPATLHHVHSGSISSRLASLGMDPMKTRRGIGGSEALVIPLAARYHVGDEGIDYGIGPLTWEFRWGEQAGYVDEVGEALGYNLWELHRLWQTTAKTASKHDSST